MTVAAPLKQTEKDFQAAVVEFLRLKGWLVYHPYDSRRSEPGFPDLVCVRERVVWIELKVDGGRLSPHQRKWLDQLENAGQETYVLFPCDWPLIKRVMK